jgi:catechol 2,3-dioxygenase-like lactoylglutathione lyase family enzyme
MFTVFNALIPELSVTSLRVSLDFYTRVLGFSISYQREEDGFAFLHLGHAQLMIDQIDKGRTWNTAPFEYPLGRGVNFQIEVDGVEPLIARLEQNGFDLFLGVEERWYRENDHEVGNKQFLVTDPDGYLLRFTEHLGRRAIS